MNSLFKKAISGAAALGVAVAGLALGASSAYAADDPNYPANPTTGSITINLPSNNYEHTFNGWHLASLTSITYKVNDDGTTKSINGFLIDTDNDMVSAIEGAMTADQLAGYKADGNYYTANGIDNNPMGYLVEKVFKDQSGAALSELNSPWGGDSSPLRAFATSLQAELAKNGAQPADKTGNSALKTGANENLEQGLWFLEDATNNEEVAKKETNSIPIITPTTFAGADGWGTVTLKNTTPTIDKKLVDPDGNGGYTDNTKPDYAVGDTVSYELTSKIPTFTGYDIDPTLSTTSGKTRVFQIIDTADKALTVPAAAAIKDGDPVVSVKVGTTKLQYGKDYTVSVADYDDDNNPATDVPDTDLYKGGHVTTIDLAKYVNMADESTSKTTGKIDEGATVTVIFQAKLNANAKISDANSNDPLENWNRDDLRYSNKPNEVSDAHKVPGKEVPVYAYKFGIHKTDKAGTKLPGAQFVIKAGADTSNNGKYLGTYTNTADDKSGWKYENTKPTACTADQITNNSCTTAGVFVSDADGNIAVEGLDSGTYEVEEIAPPAGYTAVSLPKFNFTITPTTGSEENGHKTITAVTNSKDGTDERITLSQDGKTLNIWNAKNITELPKTGGVGLVMIIAAGAMFIAAGGLFALRARRKA
ncbi:SpaH/EbpB family LPXTG-anchored major pilin [Bifidobacterium olomucense]|uniref:Collagen-binding protein n=1 Tax=Bifidobacterium olomucense TaxID=2675324 RepID=A0A7Y0EY85_9BIFI|nr:SpaH/EbpB family LPXTG-anchored major pilin [Bifidobacterium sp. DSM 109959]NMM98602.1 collagen-binding protein [Bifidobacterium sp. DSM 109959]